MTPRQVPAGKHYLVFDSEDADWTWALYLSEGRLHKCVVDWAGEANVASELHYPLGEQQFSEDRFVAYILTPEQVDAAVMLSMHKPGIEGWKRFCARIAQREVVT